MTVYRINGRVVSRAVFLARPGTWDPQSRRAPLTCSDRTDWSRENDGRGRYCGQLGTKLDDPQAFCRSKADLIEKGRRRGFIPEGSNPQI
jgi:hypothetical protein